MTKKENQCANAQALERLDWCIPFLNEITGFYSAIKIPRGLKSQ